MLDALLWTLHFHEGAGKQELYEDALPLVSSPAVRREIESELGEPAEELTYWQGAGDEIEDDDEDDEDLA